jgi:hypothetical protein
MLKQLIKKLKFDYVNPDITEVNFPDDGQRGKVEILYFNEVLTTEKVLEKIEKKGYRPATLYELINYVKDWNGKDLIAALGSVWQRSDGDRNCPFLCRGGTWRRLSLGWVDDGWNDSSRFAAVRVSKPLNPLKSETFGNLETRIVSLEKDIEKLKKTLRGIYE